MIRLIAGDDVPTATLALLNEPLPALAGQPLLVHDDDDACGDFLRVQRVFLEHSLTLPCNTSLVGPAGMDRELQFGDSRVVERVRVSPDRASALIEWAAHHSIGLPLKWSCHERAEVGFVFNVPVDATTLESAEASSISAHISVPARGAVRLLITQRAGDIAELDPQQWSRVHAADTVRRRSQLLRIETGNARFDELWEWWIYLQWAGDAEAQRRVTDKQQKLLGIEADAQRGRLVLRPRIPVDQVRLGAHNIRVDDALIRLLYEKQSDGCSFTIVQTAGAYPIRLILEPVFAARPVRTCVDGAIAVLDVRAQADGFAVPVQIMLDAERVVRFQFSEPNRL